MRGTLRSSTLPGPLKDVSRPKRLILLCLRPRLNLGVAFRLVERTDGVTFRFRGFALGNSHLREEKEEKEYLRWEKWVFWLDAEFNHRGTQEENYEDGTFRLRTFVATFFDGNSE